MNVKMDLEKFKRLLLEEKKRILEKYEMPEEENDEGATDIVDEAAESNKRRLIQTLSYRDSVVLKQIEGALQRIEEGTYGICLKCGRLIPERRLELIPYAPLCVSCQEKEEKKIGAYRRRL